MKSKMINIGKNKFVGCGVCSTIYLEEIGVKDENVECLKDAIDICYKRAIIFNEKNFGKEDTNINNVQDRIIEQERDMGTRPRNERDGGCGNKEKGKEQGGIW